MFSLCFSHDFPYLQGCPVAKVAQKRSILLHFHPMQLPEFSMKLLEVDDLVVKKHHWRLIMIREG